MGTHDEETRKFFHNSGVTCVLFPREGANQQASIVNRNTTDRIFTHHQKTVRLCPKRFSFVSVGRMLGLNVTGSTHAQQTRMLAS